MADGKVACVSDPRRAWLRIGAGFAAIVLFLVVAACDSGASEEDRRSALADHIRTNYEVSLQSIRPQFVMITYPESVATLPEIKRKELDIVRKILKEKGIAFAMHKRSELLEVVTGKAGEQRSAYNLPADVAESCRGGKVLFLNLDVHNPPETGRHPELRKLKIRVLVSNDPLLLTSWSGS